MRQMQPSVGGANVGNGVPVGSGYRAELVPGDPEMNWDLITVGSYVMINSGAQFGQFAMTVAMPVESGRPVTNQPIPLQQLDSQLWTARQTNGLWTFVPKLAPQYVLQMTDGAILVGGILSVGPPSDNPELQATQLWIFTDD